MEYKEFRVVILNENDVRAILPSETTCKGNIAMDRLTKSLISVFDSMVSRGKIDNREELQVFGSILYTILFQGEIDTEFKRAFDEIGEQPDTRLRLVLEFEQEARALATLPWEYLYYPDTDREKGFPIGSQSKIILTRHVPLSSSFATLTRTERPLRILIAVSRPRDLSMVSADDVIQALEKLREQFPGAIEVERLDNPDPRSFHQKIGEVKPHVLHFIGHGQWDIVKQSGALAFVGEDGSSAWIRDRDFSDYFMDYQPRLVFLQACEGAESQSYEGLRGLALQLIYSKIPAVIAMQYPITNRAATQFAVKFYACLGEGKPIDLAVQEGRLELGMYLQGDHFSSREFGSPVAFLQSKEGIIIPGGQPEAPPPITTPVIASKVSCPNPDCTGLVSENQIICLKCHHELAKCPNGHLIDKNLGKCAFCGYGFK